MLANIAIIILISLLFAYVFKKMQLPELLGMVLAGVLLGPYMRQFVESFLPQNVIKLFWRSVHTYYR